jgi:hypothetical protein
VFGGINALLFPNPAKSGLAEWKERKPAPRSGGTIFRLEHWRNAAGFAAAAMLGGGISASTADHSHETVTYWFWYGCAGAFILTTIILTGVIERRRMKAAHAVVVTTGPPVTAPGPGESLVIKPLPEGGWEVSNPTPALSSTTPTEAGGYSGEGPPTSGA